MSIELTFRANAQWIFNMVCFDFILYSILKARMQANRKYLKSLKQKKDERSNVSNIVRILCIFLPWNIIRTKVDSPEKIHEFIVTTWKINFDCIEIVRRYTPCPGRCHWQRCMSSSIPLTFLRSPTILFIAIFQGHTFHERITRLGSQRITLFHDHVSDIDETYFCREIFVFQCNLEL